MRKLDYDELFQLEMLLDRFEDTFEGELPEYSQGAWSRRNLEALLRDIETLKKRS